MLIINGDMRLPKMIDNMENKPQTVVHLKKKKKRKNKL